MHVVFGEFWRIRLGDPGYDPIEQRFAKIGPFETILKRIF
jgi:hypothetical protein